MKPAPTITPAAITRWTTDVARPGVADPTLTEEAATMDRLWGVFLVIATVIGVLVAVLLVYSLIRFRRRDDRLPEQVRHHLPTEIAYTLVPFLIVIGLFVGTFVTVRAIERADEYDLVVDVDGFQWQWRFRYPDHGIVVTGTEDVIPELVLPADTTVRFRLNSLDVIHSFWIPGFRYKRDMFPGQTAEFDVAVEDELGTYDGACAEFCGLAHSEMNFTVRIVDIAEFDAWAAEAAAATAAGEVDAAERAAADLDAAASNLDDNANDGSMP